MREIIAYILMTPLLWIFFIPLVGVVWPEAREDGNEKILAAIAFIFTLGVLGIIILKN